MVQTLYNHKNKNSSKNEVIFRLRKIANFISISKLNINKSKHCFQANFCVNYLNNNLTFEDKNYLKIIS